MSKYYGNVVLITGASSGIGKATAEYLAQKGYRVYGTSRKVPTPGEEAILQDSSPRDSSPQVSSPSGASPAAAGVAPQTRDARSSAGAVTILRMDVCSEESVKTAVEQVLAAEGELGIVINNAGMGIAGSVEDTSPEEAQLQLDTNFFGMHRVIRQVLPAMRRQGRGLLINMSSVGAVFPIPFQSMYVASKAAIEGMSGSLRNELRPFGIKVAVVEPGDTKTGFTGSRIFVKAGEEGSAYAEQSRKSIAVMERDEAKGPDPIVVAKAVGKIIKRKNPPLCVAVGLQYKLFLFLKRFMPQKVVSFVVSKMYGC